MGYRVVTGSFHLFYEGERHVGGRPDGDSVWFKPDSKMALNDIAGRSAKLNAGGCAQLRLEGIDALELHYPGNWHQRAPQCTDARDELLRQAGFKSVTFAPSTKDLATTVRTATPHPMPGYILVRAIDPYFRPVSFAFTGKAPAKKEVYLDVALLNKSVNIDVLAVGQAYPAFYTGLPTDLRKRLIAVADGAATARRGVWKVDQTNTGTSMSNATQLQGRAIWPKLYRRLIKYFLDGHSGLSGFDGWLRADKERDDQLWIVSKAEFANMHDIVEVASSRIRMKYKPKDLIVVPR